jgi:hypothetical protein
MEFRQKKSGGFMKYILIIVVVVLGAAGAYVKFSPEFEQDKPQISMEDNIFWNLRTPLDLTLTDQSGIKFYKVSFNDGTKDIELDSQILSEPAKTLNLKVKPPKLDIFFKGETGTLKIEAFDNSKWNFLEGNKANKTINVKIDKRKPTANVIANSLAIRHGGSAVAVVKVEDENLKDAYITFNDEVRFELIPFHKPGYFVSLIAWPVQIEKFKIVNLVASDLAGNIRKTKIPLFIRSLKIKHDNITISDSFINNVSKNVLEQSGMDIPADAAQTFVKQNKEVREKNIALIKEAAMKFMDRSMISELDINIFKRLKGSRTAAGFAEKRTYFHNGIQIDEAWHLGMDWASIKKAPIKISNDGKVIFNNYLGIYGNTIIVDHKMGLQSLYAHVSSSDVNEGDYLTKNTKIANTGSTGAVLGDHLHFGMLVQGIEVDPKEWMDRNWIKSRITDILKVARETIDSK